MKITTPENERKLLRKKYEIRWEDGEEECLKQIDNFSKKKEFFDHLQQDNLFVDAAYYNYLKVLEKLLNVGDSIFEKYSIEQIDNVLHKCEHKLSSDEKAEIINQKQKLFIKAIKSAGDKYFSEIPEINLSQDSITNPEKKKQNLLTRDLLPTLEDEISIEQRDVLKERIKSGSTITQQSAKFKKDDEGKHYLDKKNPIESKFGSDMFRILSKKRYVAKREILETDGNKLFSVIKFDGNLSDESFLHQATRTLVRFNDDSKKSRKFFRSYARMCGVLHVLGESDDNPDNFLISLKNGKPAKIDNSFLVNYHPIPFGYNYALSDGDRDTALRFAGKNYSFLAQGNYDLAKNHRFRIYGSAQARDFMRFHLADNIEIHKNTYLKNNFEYLCRYEKKDQILPEFSRIYINYNNEDLDDSLLEKIKSNLTKPNNEHLKDCFIEMMLGMKDAIDLARNDEFLDQYIRRYSKLEIDDVESVITLLNQCKSFYKENANQATKQFAKYFEYCNELIEEKKEILIEKSSQSQQKVKTSSMARSLAKGFSNRFLGRKKNFEEDSQFEAMQSYDAIELYPIEEESDFIKQSDLEIEDKKISADATAYSNYQDLVKGKTNIEFAQNCYVRGAFFFAGELPDKSEVKYKANIQVHQDDLEKAVELLINKGLFYDEKKWGNTIQKCAISGKKNDLGLLSLSIILYQGNEAAVNDEEKINLWSERLTNIETTLLEAGIRPRALNNVSHRGSVINDKKIPGALYCYYKKDEDYWDNDWDDPNYDKYYKKWERDNGFVGKAFVNGLEEIINQKISSIKHEISNLSKSDNKERESLEKTIIAYQIYAKISAMSHADAQKIQHNRKSDRSKPSQGELGLKDELEIANATIEQYSLRKKVKLKDSNILDSDCDAIVNIDSALLDMGNYEISGLNKKIHDDIDGEIQQNIHSITIQDKTYYYPKKESILVRELIKQNQDSHRNKTTSLTFYHDTQCQEPAGKTSIVQNILKRGEVAIVDLSDVADVNASSKLKNKTIIHAGGLDYTDSNVNNLSEGKRIEKLKNIYREILNRAFEKGAKKIALTALSFNIFQLPEEETAHAISEAIREKQHFFDEIQVFSSDQQNAQQTNILPLIDIALFGKETLPYLASETQQGHDGLVREFKEGFHSSLTPRRFQAVLGMLHHYCNVKKEEFDVDLSFAIDNPEKFKDVIFDYKKDRFSQKDTLEHDYANRYNKILDNDYVYGSKHLDNFNASASEFLSRNNDMMWNKLASFVTQEAICKDLLRIKNKFNFEDDNPKFAKIIKSYQIIFDENSQNDELESAFNEIKKLFIKERLQKKLKIIEEKTKQRSKKFSLKKEHFTTITEDEINNLAEDYISNGQSLDQIKDRLSNSGLSENKIEKIFTKFVALGKVENLEELQLLVKEKKIAEFQNKFSNEIMALDGLANTKISGDEILFRGIIFNQGIDIEEQKSLIKNDFLNSHFSISNGGNKTQKLGSYQILKERISNPEQGIGSRISYAVSTSFDPKIAAKYATVSGPNYFGTYNTDSGWVYEIRPKKGKNVVRVFNEYKELDFPYIDSEDIYAAYRLDLGHRRGELTVIDVLLNPNYKKRSGDLEDSDLKSFFNKHSRFIVSFDKRNGTITSEDPTFIRSQIISTDEINKFDARNYRPEHNLLEGLEVKYFTATSESITKLPRETHQQKLITRCDNIDIFTQIEDTNRNNPSPSSETRDFTFNQLQPSSRFRA